MRVNLAQLQLPDTLLDKQDGDYPIWVGIEAPRSFNVAAYSHLTQGH